MDHLIPTYGHHSTAIPENLQTLIYIAHISNSVYLLVHLSYGYFIAAKNLLRKSM
jgi:hypothetical protein